MTAAAPAEPRPWSNRRWWGLVVVVFAVQFGLIFWLGKRTPGHPRRLTAEATLRLAAANGPTELLALSDPTLLALPRPQGFSGLAWLRIRSPERRSFAWSESPRWLSPSLSEFGLAFRHFMDTNNLNALPARAGPQPELAMPDPAPLPLSRKESELRLEAGLAHRRLTRPIELPPWPHSDILTNTVVQLAVDAAGRPQSFTLLPPGSGSREADQYALDQAQAARFESASDGGTEPRRPQTIPLTWGLMVFQWHTLPTPPTNAPSAGP